MIGTFETAEKKGRKDSFIFQDYEIDVGELHQITDDNNVQVLCSDLSRSLQSVEKSPLPIERARPRVNAVNKSRNKNIFEQLVTKEDFCKDKLLIEENADNSPEEFSRVANLPVMLQKRDSSEHQKDQQLKTDLLHVAIVDIYCTLKKQINKYSSQAHGAKVMQEADEQMSEEEQKRLLRLGNLVLADYVRSMVDLLVQNMDESH